MHEITSGGYMSMSLYRGFEWERSLTGRVNFKIQPENDDLPNTIRSDLNVSISRGAGWFEIFLSLPSHEPTIPDRVPHPLRRGPFV